MQVFKFGGTSVGSIERIEHVAEICAKHQPAAIAVSAMAGETNRLLELGQQLIARSDIPEYDMLLASGEQVAVALLSMALRKRGMKPAPMLAPQAGIRTDEQFSRATILSINRAAILAKIADGFVPVIAGFQGVTSAGDLTTIGRGGSDTTAVAVAAAIGADTCVIYTDVDGVFSTDPRKCCEARLLTRVHFEEMLEMASQGSKVLHIRSVHLAAKWGVRLIVRNTFTDALGTEMIDLKPIEGELVTGIAASEDEALFVLGPMPWSIQALPEVFNSLAEQSINVDIINQNMVNIGHEVTISFTINANDILAARDTLMAKFPTVPLRINSHVAKISMVGIGMRIHAGVAAKMFSVLSGAGIEIILVTTSEIKIACLIRKDQATRAIQLLHEAFVMEDSGLSAKSSLRSGPLEVSATCTSSYI